MYTVHEIPSFLSCRIYRDDIFKSSRTTQGFQSGVEILIFPGTVRRGPRSFSKPNVLTEHRNIQNCFLFKEQSDNEEEAPLARCEAVRRTTFVWWQKLDQRMRGREIEERSKRRDHRPYE